MEKKVRVFILENDSWILEEEVDTDSGYLDPTSESMFTAEQL